MSVLTKRRNLEFMEMYSSLVSAVMCSEQLLPWPLDFGNSLVTKKYIVCRKDFSRRSSTDSEIFLN